MKSVVNPLPKPFAPEFGTQGALRQPFGAHGRAHLDRWLPFLFVNTGSNTIRRLHGGITKRVDAPNWERHPII